MKRNLTFLIFSTLGPHALQMHAQFLTVQSQADLYVAHVTDGGPASNRWTTQFRFVNSGSYTGSPANGTIYFYGDDGSPLMVDFGSGSFSAFTISVPVGGAARIETSGNSPTVREGFVRMVFDSPVQVTAEFRDFLNGQFANGASVNGTTPASGFWYFADAYTGIAIANPNNFAVNCSGSFFDPNGNVTATNTSIAVPPLHHIAFTLGGYLSLSPSAVGSFQLRCADTFGEPAGIVSLGTAGNAKGITSSLPDSALATPIHHGEDIEKAFNYAVKLIKTSPSLSQYASLVGQPQLIVASDDTQINACATRPQSPSPCNGPVGTVKVWLSLAELLADSPSELAFVIAHELGHVVQLHLGNQTSLQMISPPSSFNQTIETDADLFGFEVVLAAGYDPYGIAGALGKLMMITGNSTINQQYEADIQALLGTDLHTSVLNRLNNLYNTIQIVCQATPAACQSYRSQFHPDFPVWAPLSHTGPRQPATSP